MIIVVTGASRGIGLAIVNQIFNTFKENNSITETPNQRNQNLVVIGIGRTDPNSSTCPEPLRALIERFPSSFLYLTMDLHVPPGNELPLDDIKIAYQSFCSKKNIEYSTDSFVIDTIVYNAGTLNPSELIRNANIEDWSSTFNVNFFSALKMAKWMLYLHSNAKFSIPMTFIFVSSGAAVHAYETWGAYCTSKAAGNMLIQQLACEENNRLLSISIRPGVVDTKMQEEIRFIGIKSGMSESTFLKFQNAFEKGQLLSPDVPAKSIAQIIQVASSPSKRQQLMSFNGSFLSWNDKELESILSIST